MNNAHAPGIERAVSEFDKLYLRQQLESLYGAYSNKTVLITGATGFFGKWFLESAIQWNEAALGRMNIIALSRNPQSFLEEHPRFANRNYIQYIQDDVRDFTVSGLKADYIIHAATEASAKLEKENPEEMYSVVTDGTRHVLDVAKQLAVKGILLTSSGAVYGPQPPEISRLCENSPCLPVTAYGKGKLEAENMLHDFSDASGVEVKIARCFAFVGPYLNLDIHFAIGNFIRNAMEGQEILIKGDGTPLRSYLYASELVIWLWNILLRGENHCVYNVGSDNAVSILELARRVAAQFENPPEIRVVQKINPLAPIAQYVPSIAKIQRELGLQPTVSLDDAIQKTIAFHQYFGK